MWATDLKTGLKAELVCAVGGTCCVLYAAYTLVCRLQAARLPDDTHRWEMLVAKEGMRAECVLGARAFRTGEVYATSVQTFSCY